MAHGGEIRERAIAAATAALEQQGMVAAFDVLQRLNWLHERHVKLWQRRHSYYESIEDHMQSTRPRRTQVLRAFAEWGRQKGLEATAVSHYPNVRNPQRELQVTPDGDPELEQLFRLCFIKPDLGERKREAVKDKVKKRPDLLVFLSFREEKCAECDAQLEEGALVFLEAGSVLCLACADLDHLVFLPSGDVALTRRARKHSPLSAVVLKHHRRLRRQQRIGLLVTEDALAKAEEECLADEEQRRRSRERAEQRRCVFDKEFAERMTAEIRRLFPGCPATEASTIAGRTCVRGSGRVGRSRAARDLDPSAIALAVRAHIRHVHTNYDELLFRMGDRAAARETVARRVDAIADRWRRGR